MNRRGIGIVAVALWAALAGLAPTAAGAGRKGVSLTLWDETVNLGQLSASLDNLAAIGVAEVAVNVWWFQDDINSTTIAPDFGLYSASDASVQAVIDAVHARGMKVMLKPLVDLSNDPSHWRGQIVGGNAWFTGPGGYGDFINHFADLAEAKSVEIFCVGTELTATAGQEADWRGLISGVRGRFSGELTYAANHGGGAAVTAATINWWDAVDYFGLDAYYPLTGKNDPTVTELQAAWSAQAGEIATWQAGIDPAKTVLFTEVGYRSWDGTNRYPYSGADKGDANVDEGEQADCYEALLAELWEHEPWLEGLYWWNWEVDPDPTWEADNWYTPQGKPAQAVLARYYDPAPGDANFDGCVDGLDYVAWSNNYNGPAGWREGDFNADGAADGLDYVTWSNNYHVGCPAPEPATAAILLAGAAVLLGAGRRRRVTSRRRASRGASS